MNYLTALPPVGVAVELFNRRTGEKLGPGKVLSSTSGRIGISHPGGGYTGVTGIDDPAFGLLRDPA